MTPDTVENLFGLQEPQPRFPFRIVGAIVDPLKEEVRISLSAGAEHSYTIMIRKPAEDRPYFLRTGQLFLLYQGEELDESLGLYLAVNSIPDSYLVMDGPTCCFYRTDFIQGNHDAASTLLNCSGMHRVLNTCADVNNIVLDRSEAIRRILVNLRGNPLCKCIFVAALPMSYLTGVQYDGIVREADDGTGAPIHLMPHRSLQADWLAGYADALQAIAQDLDLSGGDARPGRVGIVGYFMDRGEEDHLANIRELRRLLAALSLETAPVWLSGEEDRMAPAQRLHRAEVPPRHRSASRRWIPGSHR